MEDIIEQFDSCRKGHNEGMTPSLEPISGAGFKLGKLANDILKRPFPLFWSFITLVAEECLKTAALEGLHP
jgi:hypothetical protein